MKFKRIRQGITAAQKKAFPYVQDLEDLRIIVFSDHHRGSRDGADDFQNCEETYKKALQYYLEQDYTLILLGDVEELWENKPENVLNTYQEVVELEREFHVRKRLFRIWGNHDDLWQFPDSVKRLMPNFPALTPFESIQLQVKNRNQEIGRILFIHGHQGTLMSAQLADFSKFMVRFFWRPFQRIFKVALSTPSKNKELRSETDKAMDLWGRIRTRQLIVCGHTHQYIFGSSLPMGSQEKPVYFNTGCCSYGNGNISGIELSDKQIKLIEWTPQDAAPYEIQKEKLTSIFDRCAMQKKD